LSCAGTMVWLSSIDIGGPSLFPFDPERGSSSGAAVAEHALPPDRGARRPPSWRDARTSSVDERERHG
jgi:hypothetical protein